MKRREFLKYSAAAAGLSALPWISWAGEKPTKKYANDIVTLGKTGIKASRLAMGTGTHGVNKRSNQSRRLGIEGVADLLYAAYERGINFWDSADQYGTHPHLKEALKRIPREKVVILTKTHATTAEEMRADIDRFRKEIGTDYIDIVLLHFMTNPEWPKIKAGAMEELAKLREQGVVRAHGVSCHTLGALQAAADSDWVQVDLARINPYGATMDDKVEVVVPILKRMHEQGKSVLGMKIFGAGQLRDKVDECLRFILAQDYVDAFTIGQENKDELFDLIRRIPEASMG
ncbi:MAG: aldo/keto reductase [candidate division KSB1 bacterium]|nr:aldo/keto reductase [candidate division KSB1 bacterium]MDZ7345634.1 aldo/keto reductase [candidate division KSB1 bacterium]